MHPISRRDFLSNSAGGIASVALSHILAGETFAGPPEFKGGLHHPAKVRRIIQLFMNGGVSQMDTFDYTPELAKQHGQMSGPKDKPEGQTAAVFLTELSRLQRKILRLVGMPNAYRR